MNKNSSIRFIFSMLIIVIISYLIFNFRNSETNKTISNKCLSEKFRAILVEKKKTNRAYVLKLRMNDGLLFEPRCGVSENLFNNIIIGDSLIKIKEINECTIKKAENKTISLLYIDEW